LSCRRGENDVFLCSPIVTRILYFGDLWTAQSSLSSNFLWEHGQPDWVERLQALPSPPVQNDPLFERRFPAQSHHKRLGAAQVHCWQFRSSNFFAHSWLWSLRGAYEAVSRLKRLRAVVLSCSNPDYEQYLRPKRHLTHAQETDEQWVSVALNNSIRCPKGNLQSLQPTNEACVQSIICCSPMHPGCT
jgi:hypothetical protein